MALFAIAAMEKSQPISNIYSAAAEKIDATCGADFANKTVVTSSSSASFSRLKMSDTVGSMLLLLLTTTLLSFSVS